MAAFAIEIRRHFAKLPDPRIERRKRHLLIDIIAIAICAVIADADNWIEIEAFGRRRLDWLKGFLALPNGIPSHDTFERVFDRLQPRAFQRCFLRWIEAFGQAIGKHIAIDGKSLCGSRAAAGGLGPLHLVSAWATEAGLILGEVAVSEKSNEITAVPQLLELLELKGALVTLDAMGCQKEIARQVVAGGGDYILTVKDNQPTLLEDIQQCLIDADEKDFAGVDHDQYQTTEEAHGRREKRTYTIIRHPEGIRQAEAWEGLSVIGMCYRERTVAGQTSEEASYFIGSMSGSARQFGKALRNHWRIENNLHWQLDVTFREDASRIRRRTGGENFAMLRRMALVLLKRHPEKSSMATKRYQAALDVDFLGEILLGQQNGQN